MTRTRLRQRDRHCEGTRSRRRSPEDRPSFESRCSLDPNVRRIRALMALNDPRVDLEPNDAEYERRCSRAHERRRRGRAAS